MGRELRYAYQLGDHSIVYWSKEGKDTTVEPGSSRNKAEAWRARMKMQISPGMLCGNKCSSFIQCNCAATIIHDNKGQYEREITFFANLPWELLELKKLPPRITPEMCAHSRTKRHVLNVYANAMAGLFAAFQIPCTKEGFQAKTLYLQWPGQSILLCPDGLSTLLECSLQFQKFFHAGLIVHRENIGNATVRKRKELYCAGEKALIGDTYVAEHAKSKEFNRRCMEHLAVMYGSFSDLEISQSCKRKCRQSTRVLFHKANDPLAVPSLSVFFASFKNTHPRYTGTLSAFYRRYSVFKQHVESYSKDMLLLTTGTAAVLLQQKGKRASSFVHGNTILHTTHACDVYCFPIDDRGNVLETCFEVFTSAFGYNGTRPGAVFTSAPGNHNIRFYNPKTSSNNELVDLLGKHNHQPAKFLLENVISCLAQLGALDTSDKSVVVKANWIVEKMSLTGSLESDARRSRLKHKIKVQAPWNCYEAPVLFGFDVEGTKVMDVFIPVSREGGFMLLWMQDPSHTEESQWNPCARFVYITFGTALVIPATAFHAFGLHSGFAATVMLHLQVIVNKTCTAPAIVPNRQHFHFHDKAGGNGATCIDILTDSNDTAVPTAKLRELAKVFLI